MLIIDLREKEDFEKKHANGAINLPPANFSENFSNMQIPKDTDIMLYCYSGARSRTTINILKSMGYKKLTNGINLDHLEQNSGIS